MDQNAQVSLPISQDKVTPTFNIFVVVSSFLYTIRAGLLRLIYFCLSVLARVFSCHIHLLLLLYLTISLIADPSTAPCDNVTKVISF